MTDSHPHRSRFTRPHRFQAVHRGALAWVALLTLAIALPVGSLASTRGGPCAGGVLYVDPDASGTGDGSSWADAYTDLQPALLAASSPCEIWVAAGVYKPIEPADPSNVSTTEREAAFVLKNGVALYGGFAGTESERGQRDWTANVTVLSGDLDQNDTANGNGVVVHADDAAGDNSYQIMTGSEIGPSAIVDGFTVTAGRADGPATFSDGGGMYNNPRSSPMIANTIFSGNFANNSGGGVLNLDESNPAFSNVRFQGNTAQFGGGMLSEIDSNPSLNTVVFFNNSASVNGGGMRTVFLTRTLTLSLTNVVFRGNSTPGDGGAFNQIGGTTELTNVTFSGNSSGDQGGGAWLLLDDPARLTNISVSGNRAASEGGGLFVFDPSPSYTIENSVFWNNADSSGTGTAASSISYSVPSFLVDTEFQRSLVQGCNPNGNWNTNCGVDGGNNLPDADPLFVTTPDPATAPNLAGNLRLQAGSPALNAGDNALNLVPDDLAGNARVVTGTIDLGAFERPAGTCPSGGVMHVDPDASQPGDGQDWASAFSDLQDALLLDGDCDLWIAEGVYRPSPDPTDRDATFQLSNGVALYGGFDGSESTREQRDWRSKVTVLSGDINDNNQTDASGVLIMSPPSGDENSLHVVTASGTDATARLDGVIVTGGQAAPEDGTNSPPWTCTTTCGGGLFTAAGGPIIANTRFVRNAAEQDGGGIFVRTGSDPQLINVRFEDNIAGRDGGGLSNFDSTSVLVNAVLSGNRSVVRGGGISSDRLFVSPADGSPTLVNVTASGNLSSDGGGMYTANDSNPSFLNVLFWGNEDQTGVGSTSSSLQIDGASPVLRYSLVQGRNPAGDGNLDGTDPGNDPRFIKAAVPGTSGANLRLDFGSAAIDAGDPATDLAQFPGGPGQAVDADGNLRTQPGGPIDLGAFEFDGIYKDGFELDP